MSPTYAAPAYVMCLKVLAHVPNQHDQPSKAGRFFVGMVCKRLSCWGQLCQICLPPFLSGGTEVTCGDKACFPSSTLARAERVVVLFSELIKSLASLFNPNVVKI